MGKRRDSREFFSGDDGIAAAGKCYGGGGGGERYRVFDFDDVDMRVESESRKTLAKYGTRSPIRKASHHHQPVDKYLFLQSFACDAMTPQSQSMVQPSHVGGNGIECYSCGAKSPAKGQRDSGGGTAGQKHNMVLYVHSDEEECTELRSPTIANLGSLEEQSSDCGKHSKNNDCEAMVVLDPSYVKCGNQCYTRCHLIFSKRWIQLEGSPLCDRNMSYCVEWTNFDISTVECQLCESVGANVVNLLMKACETGNQISGCVELEFGVPNDPQWSKKQEEIKSLDLQYKSAWKTIKGVCNFNEPFEEVTYPDGDPDAVFISRGDVELLQPKTFINDTLIDFYIKYLAAQIKPEEQHRFYFFNTFFFRKFVDMDRDAYRIWDVRETYQRVRKWTRNVNLFEKDYIFMPINYSLHWSLLVICHPGEVANIGEGSTNNSSKVPRILHMDSISGSHRGFEDLIKRYLWEEWKEQQNVHKKSMAIYLFEESKEQPNIDEDCIMMKFQNLEFAVPKLPQQENLFDCGLFLLHYAELFLERVSNTRTPAYFEFLNEDWFHPAEVSLKKRDQIRKLIYRIVEKKALKSPLATCDDNYLHTTIVNEGDTSEQSVQEISASESCLAIKFCPHDDCHEVTGQQSDIIFTTNERCQPCKQKQRIPISEFNNMLLPMEEGPERQSTFPPHVVADIDESYEANHVLKVTSPAEEEKERYEISSTSSAEDLANCVVEDSEEDLTDCVAEDSEEEILFDPLANRQHVWKSLNTGN